MHWGKTFHAKLLANPIPFPKLTEAYYMGWKGTYKFMTPIPNYCN